MAEAYPLHWPEGWKRTSYRIRSKFKTGFGAARNLLFAELDRMGASKVIVSTNIPLRNDGLPRANMRPDGGDTGVAVYFQRKGKPVVFACDKYSDRLAKTTSTPSPRLVTQCAGLNVGERAT